SGSSVVATVSVSSLFLLNFLNKNPKNPITATAITFHSLTRMAISPVFANTFPATRPPTVKDAILSPSRNHCTRNLRQKKYWTKHCSHSHLLLGDHASKQ